MKGLPYPCFRRDGEKPRRMTNGYLKKKRRKNLSGRLVWWQDRGEEGLYLGFLTLLGLPRLLLCFLTTLQFTSMNQMVFWGFYQEGVLYLRVMMNVL